MQVPSTRTVSDSTSDPASDPVLSHAPPELPAGQQRGGDVRLVDVSKTFDGLAAVEGVTLDVPAGSYCCFLGPSGCGKTTILRMIAGHEDPTAGEIRIGGKNVAGLTPAARRTAMMFQSYALFPHLNVRDNIAFALRVRGVARASRHRAADEMMEKVRLTELADRLPAQLSGGQQQRVALARAAVTEPQVLLLDEPLSALDEQLRVQMRQELRRMQRTLGITFIHVTHSQLEAIALADLVVVMAKGRIRQAGSAREVYDSPRDRYVAQFLGGQNVLHYEVEKVNDRSVLLQGPDARRLEVPLAGRMDLAAGARVDIAVRRDDIQLRRPGRAGQAGLADGAPGMASVSARVRAVEYQGYFVKVLLDVRSQDHEFVVYVSEREFFGERLDVGDAVLASWKSDLSRLLALGD
jgi:putative spermidine/putrescine transport system ATP-binding protein